MSDDATTTPVETAWQPVATAPHGQWVQVGWWVQGSYAAVPRWHSEVSMASFGTLWRRRHPAATHWRALPVPPAAAPALPEPPPKPKN